MSDGPNHARKRDLKTDRARSLRQRAPFPERLLWGRLRDSGLGAKFRRQQPIGSFIVDFFCAERAIIVELDGKSHLGRGVSDRVRQQWLESEGYRVVRVTNDDVVHRLNAVCEFIRRACESADQEKRAEAAARRKDASRGG